MNQLKSCVKLMRVYAMRKFPVIIFFIAMIFSSCSKDKAPKPNSTSNLITNLTHQPDTLKPWSYFPVYPGSFWKYLENDTDIIMWNTSSTYLKHSYIKYRDYDANGKLIPFYSDTVAVPFLNDKPIYQYYKVERERPPWMDIDVLWPIVSETVGKNFDRSWMDKRYGDFMEHVTVSEKTINSNLDSIIILKGYWIYPWDSNQVSTQVYTKNIGLTSHLIIDTVALDTIYKLQLIEFLINN